MLVGQRFCLGSAPPHLVWSLQTLEKPRGLRRFINKLASSLIYFSGLLWPESFPETVLYVWNIQAILTVSKGGRHEAANDFLLSLTGCTWLYDLGLAPGIYWLIAFHCSLVKLLIPLPFVFSLYHLFCTRLILLSRLHCCPSPTSLAEMGRVRGPAGWESCGEAAESPVYSLVQCLGFQLCRGRISRGTETFVVRFVTGSFSITLM